MNTRSAFALVLSGCGSLPPCTTTTELPPPVLHGYRVQCVEQAAYTIQGHHMRVSSDDDTLPTVVYRVSVLPDKSHERHAIARLPPWCSVVEQPVTP